jgi:hypothetical protein
MNGTHVLAKDTLPPEVEAAELRQKIRSLRLCVGNEMKIHEAQQRLDLLETVIQAGRAPMLPIHGQRYPGGRW